MGPCWYCRQTIAATAPNMIASPGTQMCLIHVPWSQPLTFPLWPLHLPLEWTGGWQLLDIETRMEVKPLEILSLFAQAGWL
jgi:hypothetical protein